MNDNELLDAIRSVTYEEDGKTKLSCAKAFVLATKNPATLADIGRLCNDNEIRLAKCQLGCFK